MTFEDEPETDQEEFEQAIDGTADKEVLERLWKITESRLNEETARCSQARDQASKYIGYAFTLITMNSLIAGFFKDQILGPFATTNSDFWPRAIAISLIFIFSCTVGALLRALHFSYSVMKIKTWRTWNLRDLQQVDLGQEDQSYSRYLTKGAWRIIRINKELNDNLMDAISQSLAALRGAVFTQVIFVGFGFAGSLFAPEITSNSTAQKNYNLGTQMSNTKDDNEKLPEADKKPAPVKPKPTPDPSNGSPLRRSLDDLDE